jgi:hypothetical protein
MKNDHKIAFETLHGSLYSEKRMKQSTFAGACREVGTALERSRRAVRSPS